MIRMRKNTSNRCTRYVTTLKSLMQVHWNIWSHKEPYNISVTHPGMRGGGGASVTTVIFFRRRDGITVSPAQEWLGGGHQFPRWTFFRGRDGMNIKWNDLSSLIMFVPWKQRGKNDVSTSAASNLFMSSFLNPSLELLYTTSWLFPRLRISKNCWDEMTNEIG